jgi:hypothetical protein
MRFKKIIRKDDQKGGPFSERIAEFIKVAVADRKETWRKRPTTLTTQIFSDSPGLPEPKKPGSLCESSYLDYGDFRTAVEANMNRRGSKACAHMQRTGSGLEQAMIICPDTVWQVQWSDKGQSHLTTVGVSRKYQR